VFALTWLFVEVSKSAATIAASSWALPVRKAVSLSLEGGGWQGMGVLNPIFTKSYAIFVVEI